MPSPVADRPAERVLCRNCGQRFERVRRHQAARRPSRRKLDFVASDGTPAGSVPGRARIHVEPTVFDNVIHGLGSWRAPSLSPT